MDLELYEFWNLTQVRSLFHTLGWQVVYAILKLVVNTFSKAHPYIQHFCKFQQLWNNINNNNDSVGLFITFLCHHLEHLDSEIKDMLTDWRAGSVVIHFRMTQYLCFPYLTTMWCYLFTMAYNRHGYSTVKYQQNYTEEIWGSCGGGDGGYYDIMQYVHRLFHWLPFTSKKKIIFMKYKLQDLQFFYFVHTSPLPSGLLTQKHYLIISQRS